MTQSGRSHFAEMKTPEERREWIEALHERAHGESPISEQMQIIQSALAGRCDKESVLTVVAEVLGVGPVETEGVYRFGDWTVRFDKDGNLQTITASSGDIGIVQVDGDS